MKLIIAHPIINDKNTKQIRIAQIIISEIDNSDVIIDNQELAIRNFLKKLSDHITKGASFDAFAKLHSQHPKLRKWWPFRLDVCEQSNY